MSKYIDASLFVEMQIYDEGYEEWSIWNGTIEDLLNQWTEQGCPPTIEVGESEWVEVDDSVQPICSKCGMACSGIHRNADYSVVPTWNYCPNCGADMRSDNK